MRLKDFKIGIIDRYIIGKFLTTYIGAIGMLVVVVIVFDMSEKIDEFMELHAPMKDVIFVYYGSVIPFFLNQFSALVTFITTIFFTSKMASDTEIVAILSSGINFKRFLYPYLISSILIATITLGLGFFIIPKSNKTKIEFESKYRRKGSRGNFEAQIYRQLSDSSYLSLKGYNNKTKSADMFVIESYSNSSISSSLVASSVSFNEETKRWTASKYVIRSYEGEKENLLKLANLDTLVNLSSHEIGKVEDYATTLNIIELNEFIKEQKFKGSDKIPAFEVERQSRYAYPFSTLILTLIGVSLSSRKVRGGIGLHIALGVGLCFSYIIVMQVANQTAIAGAMHPVLAVWLPNIIYAIIAIYLYKKAPK